MTNPGLTKAGIGLMSASARHTDPSMHDLTNLFQLVTVWSEVSNSFHYRRAILPFGEAWKLVAAVLEKEGREEAQPTLWITVTHLEVETSPAQWAQPSFLGWRDGATFLEWGEPHVIWAKPGFTPPSLEKLKEKIHPDLLSYIEIRTPGTI
jgi:hypothetical protein